MNDKKLTHEDVVSLLSGKMSRKEMDNLFKNLTDISLELSSK